MKNRWRGGGIASFAILLVLFLTLVVPPGTIAQGEQASPIPAETPTPTVTPTPTATATETPLPTATATEADSLSTQAETLTAFFGNPSYVVGVTAGNAVQVQLFVIVPPGTPGNFTIANPDTAKLSFSNPFAVGPAGCDVQMSGTSLSGAYPLAPEEVTCVYSFTVASTGTAPAGSTVTLTANLASNPTTFIAFAGPAGDFTTSFGQSTYILNPGQTIATQFTIQFNGPTLSHSLIIGPFLYGTLTLTADPVVTGNAYCAIGQSANSISGSVRSAGVGACTLNILITLSDSQTTSPSQPLRAITFFGGDSGPYAETTIVLPEVINGYFSQPTFYLTSTPGSSVVVRIRVNIPAGNLSGGFTIANPDPAHLSFSSPGVDQTGSCTAAMNGANFIGAFSDNIGSSLIPCNFTFTVTTSAATAAGTTLNLNADFNPDIPSEPAAAILVSDELIANDQAITVTYNQSAQGTAIASGGAGARHFAILGAPSKGSAGFAPGSANFTYTPNSGATGADSFTFRVTDDAIPANTATGTITLNITGELVANNQSIDVSYGLPFNGTLTATGGTGNNTFSTFADANAGDLTVNADGTFVYTPDTGSTGADSFQFQVSDDGTPPQVRTGTVSITISDQLSAPDQNIEVNFNASYTGQVTISGGIGTYNVTNTTVPTRGQVTSFDDAGNFTYTANTGESGGDTFQFTISDEGTPPQSVIATINVTIAPELVVTDQSYDVNYGGGVSGTLTATGGLGDLAWSGPITSPQGDVSIDPTTGDFTYTAPAGQSGTDSFTARVTDSGTPAQTKDLTVTIHIADQLVANGQAIAVNYSSSITSTLVATGGFGTLTFSIPSQPGKGAAVIIDPASGAFTYTATGGQTGSDEFTIHVVDSGSPQQSADAVIAVTIAPELVVTNQDIAVDHGGQASGTFVATGGSGILAFALQAVPTKGNAILDDPATGAFRYIANPDASGSDTFTFTVTDQGNPPVVVTGTVNVTIGEQLVVMDQAIDVAFEGHVDGTLIATGGKTPYSFSIITDPVRGSVDLDPATGDFTYTAASGQTGSDAFTFEIRDEGEPEQTATGTVTITIGDPAALIATTLTFDLDPGQAISGDLNGTVTGGIPPYIFSVLTAPTQGTLELHEDGTFTYTANADATGIDTFTYMVSDSHAPEVLGAAASITGTVTIVFAALPPTPTPTATPTEPPTPTPTEPSTPTPTPTPAATSDPGAIPPGRNPQGDTSPTPAGGSGTSGGAITQLPNTGAGSSSALPDMLLMVMASFGLLSAAALWRRRTA